MTSHKPSLVVAFRFIPNTLKLIPYWAPASLSAPYVVRFARAEIVQASGEIFGVRVQA